MLFEGLTKQTPESTHAPALAQSITISDDCKTYTFTLHNAKWSDGTKLTSHDFAYTWKCMLSPDFPAPCANLLYPIKNAKKAKYGTVPINDVGIICPDDNTLVVHLENPTPYFLELTSFCALFPVPSHIAKDHQDWANTAGPHFVCNGPFKMKSYTSNNQITLEKNHFYRDIENVDLKMIQITLVENENTAFDLFERGDLDILGMPFTNIPIDAIPDLKKQNLIQTFPIAATISFFFNTTSFPFTNKEIRKALALSINRQAIVDNITQLGEEIGTDFIPSVVKMGNIHHYIQDADYVNAQTHFDRGLEECGITKHEFPDITLLYAQKGLYQSIAQVLQESWYKQLGITVHLEANDYKTFVGRIFKKQYSIAIGKWIFQFNDMMNALDRYKHKSEKHNITGWEHPEYIELLNASTRTTNKEKRCSLLDRAENILYREMPTVPLYHMNNPMLFNPKLHGVYISPLGSPHLEYAYFE